MRISKTFVTVDAVVFKKYDANAQLLLIKRKNEPYKGKWALPGGFVEENEDLQIAALRELFEETGIHLQQMEQLKAFGKPHRDPRSHTISVAYLGFANENALPKAADDADDAQWFLLNELPELAFDHAEIINFALTKIQL